MRELERTPSPDTPACIRLAIVGQGRLGNALSEALAHGKYEITGPLGRGADAAGADVVLLCVPDREIANAAALISPGRVVGHCSGVTPLDVLSPHERFSFHPLMTIPDARRAGPSPTRAPRSRGAPPARSSSLPSLPAPSACIP